MSFWKFGFAPAASANSIDSLLNALQVNSTNPSNNSISTNSTSLNEADLYERTLDLLLGNPDLLSEIKSGTNQRLIDFLSRAEVVQRLGGWIVWGLGGEVEEEVINEGIVKDDVEDGPVPDSNVTIRFSMGKLPKRSNPLKKMVDPIEATQEKAFSGFPRLATEILASDLPSLTNTFFKPSLSSMHPETCPSASSFLIPFWESFLESTELQLETRSVQVGYWARINAILLSGPFGQEVFTLITSIPSLLPRLLAILPFCSPVNDLLLLLLRISPPTSLLSLTLIPQALKMLNPKDVDSHIAADELLRGVIELCTAAPINSNAQSTPTALSGAATPIEEEIWRENGLARQLADPKTVQMLMNWMLDNPNITNGSDTPHPFNTPRTAARMLPDINFSLQDAQTSTLIHSISVLVDLIRKNNSDFVEQQMLSWARRREAQEMERELVEPEGIEDLPDDSDRGPCLVDLGKMLVAIADRLDGFQTLVKSPRSARGLISTSAGKIAPLTLERFRICEFYAELLHCSNMSLLNRPVDLTSLYDSKGYLLRGWKAVEDLSTALSTGSLLEDEREYRPQFSPPNSYSRFPPPSSPVDIAMTYSGASTPSGAGSLDSESGILTRVEAKELRDLLNSTGGINPFSDPDDDSEEEMTEEEELVSAANAIDLDGDLHSLSPTIPKPAFNTPPSIRIGLIPLELPPGQVLKRKFLQNRVIETVLDLFFDFPWNNFLHNVVFDIVQQIFHGRIDRTLDRQLALSVFSDGRLINRILAGQAANDLAVSRPRGIRLGYMGHMSLIAEEIVKLFNHFPAEIYSVVGPSIPQPAWDGYVATTLKDTRNRDLTPLGDSSKICKLDAASISSGSGLSDEDDEFPSVNTRDRVLRAMGEGVGGGLLDQGAFGKSRDLENGSNDQFSRYLASAISTDRPDKFESSDEDDDEDPAPSSWLSGSRFDSSEFALDESASRNPSKPIQFGFEDRFDSVGKGVFRRSESSEDDEEDDEDDFKPTIRSSSITQSTAFPVTFASDGASPEGFNSSFGSDTFLSPSNGAIDDDFGDFESAAADFDFNETSNPASFFTPPKESYMQPSPSNNVSELELEIFKSTEIVMNGNGVKLNGVVVTDTPHSLNENL